MSSIQSDSFFVEPITFSGPLKQSQTWPNIFRRMDIKARLAGNPNGISYRPLDRMRERLAIENAERIRIYGPDLYVGVDGRGTPPTRTERNDPRWKIEPHWSGLPQRIIGVVGLPRPGKPKMKPYSLEYKGPYIYYWPTDTVESLVHTANAYPVGWRMAASKLEPMCSMDRVVRPHPHCGFWYDTMLHRLGEVYDPSEHRYWKF